MSSKNIFIYNFQNTFSFTIILGNDSYSFLLLPKTNEYRKVI